MDWEQDEGALSVLGGPGGSRVQSWLLAGLYPCTLWWVPCDVPPACGLYL